MLFSANESANATTAGAGAVEINYNMSARRQYKLTARNAPLWFSVVVAGGTAASVGGSTSHYLPTGGTFLVAAIGQQVSPTDRSENANFRNRISIIRDGATDATGVLSEVMPVQPQ